MWRKCGRQWHCLASRPIRNRRGSYLVMSVCKARKRQKMGSQAAADLPTCRASPAIERRRLLPRRGAARKTAITMRSMRMRSCARRTLIVLGYWRKPVNSRAVQSGGHALYTLSTDILYPCHTANKKGWFAIPLSQFFYAATLQHTLFSYSCHPYPHLKVLTGLCEMCDTVGCAIATH